MWIFMIGFIMTIIGAAGIEGTIPLWQGFLISFGGIITFGNYINFPNTTSIRGSFTLNERPGKWLQIIKTLRYTKTGWRNKLGLRNPGLRVGMLKTNYDDCLSLAAINPQDWNIIFDMISIVDKSEMLEGAVGATMGGGALQALPPRGAEMGADRTENPMNTLTSRNAPST